MENTTALGLLADEHHVYLRERVEPMISVRFRRIAVDGGELEDVGALPLDWIAETMTLHGGALYVGALDMRTAEHGLKLQRFVAGKELETLSTLPDAVSIDGIVVDGDNVFFGVAFEDQRYELRALAEDGSMRTIHRAKSTSLGPFTTALAQDDEYLYWLNADLGTHCLRRVSKAGEGEAQFSCTPEHRSAQTVMRARGDHLYVGYDNVLEEFGPSNLNTGNTWDVLRGVGYFAADRGVFAAVRVDHLWFIEGFGGGAVLDLEHETVLIDHVTPLALTGNSKALFVLDVADRQRRVLKIDG